MAARISGVTIPADKQIWVSLTYVYGIGPKTADNILAAAQVERTVRTKDLTDAEIARIQDHINERLTVEGELQRVVSANIKRLKDIKAYRGLRHAANLPSRGQRQTFDVVLLDVNMPGMGGMKTLTRLRSIAPRLPILMLTVVDGEEEKVEAQCGRRPAARSGNI